MTLEPTPAQIEALVAAPDEGPVLMLNLLRFKEQADGIDVGMTGAEAYARYGAAVAEHLERVGGRLAFSAVPQQTVIGPESESWDLMLVVEYPSRAAFLSMIGDPNYLRIHAHRDAALADSRLIACAAFPDPQLPSS